ncbi:hypothetical protein BTR22_06920 [Alkalihalophilus pseudofirmus]|nr:hypothetical protein BTR22_06920 [Alkalihalophilus pseudofirmus]
MFFEKIRKTFCQWRSKECIEEKELYRFLHTLKGTAGSIGLEEVAKTVNEKLSSLSEDSHTIWPTEKWEHFIAPICNLDEYTGHKIIKKEDSQVEISNPQITNSSELDKEFILIIDDDLEFITYTKDLLERQGYSVIVATNGKKGLNLIYDLRPSFICIDIHLPDMNGFNILMRILKKAKKTFIPIAIISADDKVTHRIQTYKLGALDFIAKPINPDIFLAYINNRLEFKQELEQLIVIDELTQVYNRKYMKERLNALIKEYERLGSIFTLVILDLDFFKQVNDTYGHLKGDEVLISFSKIVTQEKREHDIFCRYGGEEFVLLLPNSQASDAHYLMERIKNSLAETPFESDNGSFFVTFSAGIISVNLENLHPEKLLELGDQALYFAKESGRNRSITYHPEINLKKSRREVTIIIVDDDKLIRSMLKNFFSSWTPSNAYTIKVIDFEDGIDFLSSSWYQSSNKYMILLDGIMPNLDGLEVLKEIRKNYDHKDILVSMLTGRTGEEHVIKALELGADDYIVKPFDTNEVAKRVFRLIKRVFT